MLKDYIYWLQFSVILALSHFIVALIMFPMHGKRIRFTPLLMDGCLIYFAMSLTAASCGNFFKCENRYQNLDLSVLFIAFFFVITFSVVYAILVKDRFVLGKPRRDISEIFVSRFSLGAVLGSVFYCSGLFVLMCQ